MFKLPDFDRYTIPITAIPKNVNVYLLSMLHLGYICKCTEHRTAKNKEQHCFSNTSFNHTSVVLLTWSPLQITCYQQRRHQYLSHHIQTYLCDLKHMGKYWLAEKLAKCIQTCHCSEADLTNIPAFPPLHCNWHCSSITQRIWVIHTSIDTYAFRAIDS